MAVALDGRMKHAWALLVFVAAGCSSPAEPGIGDDGRNDPVVTRPSDSAPIDSGQDAGASDTSMDADPPKTGTVIEFLSSDGMLFDSIPHTGTVTLGAKDPAARDGNLVNLLFKGGNPKVGPAGAAEIDSKSAYGYGTFRFRVRLATCAKNEELVNGLFLYANDGKDHDGDGVVDNSEVDIEILCGQPNFINMTSWTGYTDDTRMKKQSRTVDLETGKVYIGNVDAYGYDEKDPRNGKVDPAFVHPGWYDANGFYEMGYAWSATEIRFFIVLGGKELTLYTTEDSTRVPKAQMHMLFNLWHPATHWNAEGAAAVAAKDATLSVDWFEYDAAK